MVGLVYLHSDFHSDCTNFHCHQPCIGFPFLHVVTNTYVFSMLTILTYEMITHHGFGLHFPTDKQERTSFHISIFHPHCLLNWVVLSFICMNYLYIWNINPLCLINNLEKCSPIHLAAFLFLQWFPFLCGSLPV